jgi:spore maturation protein CgeB
MLRILFVGESWYGSNSRSCAEGLRRLGCQVFDIDQQSFFPRVSMFSSRLVSRCLRFRLVEEINRHILSEADKFRPDIVIAMKAAFIKASTLQSLRDKGIALYNYFPDTSAFTDGKCLQQALPEYDCIFHTKPFWYSDATKYLTLRAGHFLPHGYNPDLHHPVQLDARDISDYGCDVSFVAIHSRYKENLLDELISLRPNLDLRIWGHGWTDRSQSKRLRRCIKGFPLVGERFVRAIQAARINLGIMNGPRVGASSGDLTTSRTYQIPASGGFMLHQRNPEVLDLYHEGEEIACFESVEELEERIDYYLAHPAERENIARAGHARCVPAYSYDNRMAVILRWYLEHGGLGDSQVVSAGVEAS